MKSILKLLGVLLVGTLGIVCLAREREEPTRVISIDKAMMVADAAVGYSHGRPDSLEVVTAKFFTKHQDLAAEGITSAPNDLNLRLKGKEYWLVVYRKWPLRLDDELAVFVDAHSGELITIVSSK